MGYARLHHMTRKALRSEQWCTEERAAESSTDSCSCLTERDLLTLKLLLKLLKLLRHKLNDVLKLVELLRGLNADRERLKRQGEASRKLVVEKYNWRHGVETAMGAIEELRQRGQ